MSDPTFDPPRSFAEAEVRFGQFLASNGYPATIGWLKSDHVLVDTPSQRWVDRGAKALDDAKLRYAEGLRRNLGIALYAICATDKVTFASVFVPEDDVDAQYRLMSRGLKLSCPTSRLSASVITNRLRCVILALRDRGRSKMLGL